jgi:ABC-type antimicrobial peptide transport system permease subunit
MMLDVDGVVPIESPNLFGEFREQMLGLLWLLLTMLGMAWVVCAVLVGLVFSIATKERSRQIAVLRALGGTRFFVLRSVLAEAAFLALAGSVLGLLVACLGVYMFQDYIAGSLGMPFLYPSPSSLAILAIIVLSLSVVTVAVASAIPAIRASAQEPALAMRE